MYVMRTKANSSSDEHDVSPDELEAVQSLVQQLSFPRHYAAEPEANRRAGDFVAATLTDAGFHVTVDGPYRNVVATPKDTSRPLLLIGAHYDSVPGSPGADDNGSAVAAMLSCAQAIGPDAPVCYVGFNREEDGLLGSTEFVEQGMARLGLQVSGVHILEMVGFTAEQQHVPEGLPIKLSGKGDFLGIVGAGPSNRMATRAVQLAESGPLPVLALKTYLNIHQKIEVLHRSDHSPFWGASIPATMWTDTAEFRNPNYHQATDTPDTLDYTFLARVTRLLHDVVLDSSGREAAQ